VEEPHDERWEMAAVFLRGHAKEYMRKEFSGDKNQIVSRTFHVAK
jgi:hypothetical protein